MPAVVLEAIAAGSSPASGVASLAGGLRGAVASGALGALVLGGPLGLAAIAAGSGPGAGVLGLDLLHLIASAAGVAITSADLIGGASAAPVAGSALAQAGAGLARLRGAIALAAAAKSSAEARAARLSVVTPFFRGVSLSTSGAAALMSGGGRPVALAGVGGGASTGSAAPVFVNRFITAAGAGASSGAGTLHAVVRMVAAWAPFASPAGGHLRLHRSYTASAAGSSALLATMSTRSQLVGHSGPEWRFPQIEGEAAGSAIARGTVQIFGTPNVPLES